jgi:hypothetical protein
LEAAIVWIRYGQPLLPFGRRLFTGIVIAYVCTSLTVGGTSAARTVFYGLAAAWCVCLGFRFLVCPRPPSQEGASWIRWGRRFELVVTNLVFTLVLAELVLRAYAALSEVSLLLNDTLDAYRLVPGRDYGGGLRGNRLGYPGREFEPQKCPGVYRIAALGDSFAVGPAVPFADNYLSLLENALPDTEVYNFGVSGAGPREYHAILRRDVWTFSPNLVLVSIFIGNDITETMATPRRLDPRQHALYLLLTRAGRLAQEQRRVDQTRPDSASEERPLRSLSAESFREVEARRLAVCSDPPPPSVEKKWRQALGHLDRIVADCRGRRTPVAFVLIPDEFQVNPAVLAEALRKASLQRSDLDLDAPQRRLADFCAQRGVPCLDLLRAFREQPHATYAPRDTHWNSVGNRLAASELASWLPCQITIPSVSWRQRPARESSLPNRGCFARAP